MWCIFDPSEVSIWGGGGGVGVARQHDMHSMTASIADFTQLYFTTKSDSKKEYKKQNLTKQNKILWTLYCTCFISS